MDTLCTSSEVHINCKQAQNSTSHSRNRCLPRVSLVFSVYFPAIISRHVHSTYPGVRVFHEDRADIPHGAEIWQPTKPDNKIDLVVTLGGDGTILHASSLFSAGAVPPVLSFSMGTLGFLLPFRMSTSTLPQSKSNIKYRH